MLPLGTLDVLRNCPNLTSVDVSGCGGEYDDDLDKVVGGLTGSLDGLANCTALVTLNLLGCDELTGSLHALANCTALVTLNLPGCDELTGVEKLQKALPQCRIISP